MDGKEEKEEKKYSTTKKDLFQEFNRGSVIKNFISVFFFNDTATTEIYTGEDTLSLHDALPILTWRDLELSLTYWVYGTVSELI